MDGAASLANQNPMLGCQLIGKSIIGATNSNQNGLAQNNTSNSAKSVSPPTKVASGSAPVKQKRDQTPVTATCQNRKAKQQQQSVSMCETKSQSKETNNNNNNNHLKQPLKCSSILCQTQEAQVKPIEHSPHETSLSSIKDLNTNQQNQQVDAKDFEIVAKEAQDLKIKTRKLQLEIEEKNEIINVLKEELETSKELSDKYQKENIQLLKDSKRVKFLQDENDFLQDKVGNVDKLELEIKRLKEKLNELDFLKIRIGELEEDRAKAQEDSLLFEKKCQIAEAKLTQIAKLDTELNKWKSFSNELESERNSLQSKLLESIEQETKLNLVNKQVEDEVKRLRSLIKSYEEQRAEEQASNSLIMSAADLKQFDQSCSSSSQQNDYSSDKLLDSPVADTSIKYELDQQYEKELNEENRNLKQKLNEQEVKFNSLVESNQEIRAELDGNRALIADLRQDLACEKSLALKLTNQLNNFSRQMKNLDKQYFPMHVVASSTQQSVNDLENDRKFIKRNSENNSNSNHEKKESTLLKSSTSLGDKQQQPVKPSSSEQDNKEKTNQLRANNSNDKTTDNETRQQVNIKQSSKLSARAEELTEKHYSPLDNSSIDSSKQGLNEVVEATKPTKNGKIKNSLVEQTELRPSVAIVTKNTTVNLENSEKNKDESCATSGVLSAISRKKYNTNCKLDNLATNTLPVETHDRSESTPKKALYTLSNVSEDEFSLERKHVHSNNSRNTSSESSSNIQVSASELHGTNSRSQSSSPSATLAIGHDSGFQSINHEPEALKTSSKGNAVDGCTKVTSQTESNRPNIEGKNVATLPNQSTPIAGHSTETLVLESASADKQSLTPTQNGDKVPPSNPSEDAKQISKHEGEGSHKQQQQQQQLPTANISAESALSTSSAIIAPSSPSTSPSVGLASESSTRSKPSDTTTANSLLIADKKDANVNDCDNDELDNLILNSKRAPTPAKLSRSTATSNFVRNSLPSRSVNLGHSRSSAYLDRIRASVTASTTTDTTSSFNEQARNIVLSQQGSQLPESRYLLNCMLDHQHSERCFVANSIDHIQTSQLVATNHYHRHTNLNSHMPFQSSRQLNALIDPVSHERLIVSTLPHNHGVQQNMHHAQEQNFYGVNDKAKLSEQQIAHLASIHHQHYYHHLQHMHQLHQLHHQHHLHLHHHRMHHKYEQQQQSTLIKAKETDQQPVDQQQKSSGLGDQNLRRNTQCDLIYTGGSQFYAPSAQLEQVYANTKVTNNSNNNNINQLNKYCHRTKLVKNNNDKSNQHGSPDSNGYLRTGRQGSNAKIGTVQQQQPQQAHHHYHHQIGHYTLPQIDEVNGLPLVEPTSANNANGSLRARNCNAHNTPSEAIGKTNQHNLSSNGSPSSSSSSPTSSASSNLSPSSASSTSSINSLSTSSAPLNRSSLRHTTTECHSRQQFSVERELISVLPMTAALSRVGSCRSTRPSNSSRLESDERQDIALMQTPVKSHQPSMRTSKILNISQQSSTQLPSQQQPQPQQQQQQQQQQHQLTSRRAKGLGVTKQGIDKLVNDFTNIKFNHNLAFASLRAPKSSLNKSGVGGSSMIGNNGKGQNPITSTTSSSSLERRARASNATNDDGSNKSSVWFEYGCV